MTAVADLVTRVGRRLLDRLAEEVEPAGEPGPGRLMRQPGALPAVPEPPPVRSRDTKFSTNLMTKFSTTRRTTS